MVRRNVAAANQTRLQMIDRIYTNSTDEHLYATLDAALSVYGHKIQDGRIVPNDVDPGEFGIRYEYDANSSDFHNGRDSNGRLSFLATSPTSALFGIPSRSIEYIGFSLLQGHQEATKAENKAARAKQEAITMAAAEEQKQATEFDGD